MKRAARGPSVLVAAGMEATGRVGLLADVAAVSAAGGVAMAVVTALTAQGSHFAVSGVPRRLLLAQLDAVLAHRAPGAVKLGMVPDVRTLGALWPRLVRLGVPLVVDPVVRTSRAERLSRLRPEDYLRLARPGVWMTPNVEELVWLLGRGAAPTSVEQVRTLALALYGQGFGAVVVKGGHLAGPPIDVLVSPGGVLCFSGSRLLRRPGQRGTGCRFASTLATALALGQDDVSAVRTARRAVRSYLRG